MGTYTRIKLKDQSEKEMLKINQEILSLGYRDELGRGPFYTMKDCRADVTFMNTDPEGLKQMAHLKRPITPKELLGQEIFWIQIGLFCVKISCLNAEEKYNLRIVMQWAWRNKEKIDEINSAYWTKEDALSYKIFKSKEMVFRQFV
jgi:hypothetical protein